jgi:isocitrate/isopropylmalate dehydrogenase
VKTVTAGQYTDGIGSEVVTKFHEVLIIIVKRNISCRFSQGINVDKAHLHHGIL